MMDPRGFFFSTGLKINQLAYFNYNKFKAHFEKMLEINI